MAVSAATDQQVESTEEQLDLSDQADAPDSGVSEGEQETGEAEADPEPESDSIELIGQDQFDALKNDPAALRKELNRAATKKFQDLSSQRKQLEPYADFIRELESDPRAAIEAVARQMGMQIGGAPAEVKEQVADLGEQISAHVRAALGPEYEDLADKLGPVMQRVAEAVAAETAKPLKAEQDRIIQESALRESAAALEAFGKSHPDYKKHEDAMVAVSKKLQPAPGMAESEYLDMLYILATKDAAEGDAAKRLVNRINKSTRSDSGGNRVPNRDVKVTPSGLPTFEEAAAAARRGERFEP